MSRRWLVAILGGAGLLVHFGTAVLRLNSLLPDPALSDFGAFYAGAWAFRLGTSPYLWAPDYLPMLRDQAGLFVEPAPPISPPLWLWLIRPLTHLTFTAAARVWLGVLVVLIAWSTLHLARIARLSDTRSRVLLFVLVLTFGPVFLTLSLGQNSLFLLIAVLIVGDTVRRYREAFHIPAVLATTVAVGAKVIPLIWLAALVLLDRWRLAVAIALAVLFSFGLDAWLHRSAHEDYWLHFLPDRAAFYSEEGGLEDQSLFAWLDRLGRPHTFQIVVLHLREAYHVNWSPPWSIDPDTLRWTAYGLAAMLAVALLILLRQIGPADVEGSFYLWVLVGLLAFPHTDRYNHVLLLPAMAWLWGRGGQGRLMAIVAYALAALSRLTHVWALLPAPLGPLAAGFGLYTVLFLGGGMISCLRPVQAAQR